MHRIVDEYFDKYQEMFEIAKFVIVVSNEMRNDIVRLGCPKEKIIHNPCGPNNQFASVQPDYKKKNILSIGRFVPKKAPHIAILAFAEITDNHPDSRLTMIGDGPMHNECITLSKDLGLDTKIDFPGALDRYEIIKIMNESSLFIQHSVQTDAGDKEGSPVSIMEASLAGLPIVSTNHAGITESVVNEKTGFLVKENDITSFAEKINLLLDSDQLRTSMGKNARLHIQENFSLEDHLNKLKSVINR
jgi:glycosyltransferase involved in cell wall biosynthesis